MATLFKNHKKKMGVKKSQYGTVLAKMM